MFSSPSVIVRILLYSGSYVYRVVTLVTGSPSSLLVKTGASSSGQVIVTEMTLPRSSYLYDVVRPLASVSEILTTSRPLWLDRGTASGSGWSNAHTVKDVWPSGASTFVTA